MRCAAVFIRTDGSSPLPTLIVDGQADNRQDADTVISRLVDAGLMRVSGASEIPARADGWMVLVRQGLDCVDVLMRALGRLRTFFTGDCVLREDWLESVGRIGYCLMFVGKIDMSGIAGSVADPEWAIRMIGAAAAAGPVAGGLVPAYRPGYDFDQKMRVWPGNAIYRQDSGRATQPLGLSITLDVRAQAGEAVDLVRATARGMSPKWVRQRLAIELLLRDQMMPPTIVDQIANEVASAGPAGWARSSVYAAKVGLATCWLLVGTIMAFTLRRPLPHWHIFGIHAVRTSQRGAGLEVTVDPHARELLAVGESDEFDVWLGIPREPSSVVGQRDIVVYRGDYRVGVLGDIEGIYRGILLEPRHAHTILMTDATRSRTADSSWQLHLRSPA